MKEKINAFFNQEYMIETPRKIDLKKVFEISPQYNIEGLWFKTVGELNFFGDTIYFEKKYNVKDNVENRKLLNNYKKLLKNY